MTDARPLAPAMAPTLAAANGPLPLYRAAGLRAVEAAAAGQPLMQRAGLAAADFAATLLPDRQAPLLILAGPGNNGGDGFEAGLHLLRRHGDVHLVFTGDPAALPADAAAARGRFLAAGGRELTELAAIPAVPRWGLIVDALFGIGLTRDLSGRYADLVAAANVLAAASHCPLLALDCPSGLDADTGQVRGIAVRATHTLTFIAGKPGLLTADGPDHCGEVRVAALALDAAGLVPADGETVSRQLFAEQLRPRLRNSHKGSHGSAGIVGGADGMLGAAFLAGRAALQLGAGRVYLGLVAEQPPAFDPGQPELMLRGADALVATPLTALACGPGMGCGPRQASLLAAAAALDLPLLLDADALNQLAADGDLQTAIASRQAPTLLTPHPAEAARLLDCDTAAVQADRVAAARELAGQYNAHVALKGCGTLLAAPDGRWRMNTSGNPGMACAGMGDVLTGIVVALLAQGWPAEMALAAGVHLHGAAADKLTAGGTVGGAIGGELGLTAGETIAASRRLLNRWVVGA